MDKERQKLKDFIEEHIPFDDLKKVGYWPKGTRRTDYEAIAARICYHFGFKSIYEYDMIGEVIEDPKEHCVNGRFRDKVDEKGNFIEGGGFHLSMGRTQTHFDCPICTCHQKVKENHRNSFTQKCKGCKRRLQLFEDLNGDLHISELKKP